MPLGSLDRRIWTTPSARTGVLLHAAWLVLGAVCCVRCATVDGRRSTQSTDMGCVDAMCMYHVCTM